MPGSPRPYDLHQDAGEARAFHPAASLLSLALLGAGLTMGRSWPELAVASGLLAFAALRVERRPFVGEAPLVVLAFVLFLAHVLAAGRGWRGALAPAATVAFRLLALLYLVRWAAGAALGRAARWLMSMKPLSRPRFVMLLVESARLTSGLLPLAIREAEQHVLALRARGIRSGRGLAGRARYLLAWFLPFLGTMLRIGDAYADALLTRGYVLGRARRSGLRIGWGLGETAAVLGSAASAAWIVHAL